MPRSILAQMFLGVVLVLQASVGLADPASATYSYDDLGRLRTGAFAGGAANGRKIDYQYDAAGNRTTMTSGQAPTLSIANATSTVTEGATITFPVTRNGTSSATITVKCVPQGNTALADGRGDPYADFATAAQTITFAPTDPSPTTKNCVIQTLDDAFYEGTQIMSAVLQDASAGAVIDQAHDQGSGNIADNDAAPSFTIQNGSALEGSAIPLSITRTGRSELPYTVVYSTSNGSATTADNDYSPVSQTTLLFADLQPTQLISFSVASINDGKFEAPETISILWQVNGSAMPAGMATINNDDGRPNILISDAPLVNEGGVATFTLTNNGNPNTGVTHTITWSTQNNTAAAGSDYNGVTSGTVTFGNGVPLGAIQVQTLTDGVSDGGEESFYVNLSTSDDPNIAVTFGDTQGVGRISDNDNPVPGKVPNVTTSPANNQATYQVLWGQPSGAISYYVLEESLDSETDWHQITTTPANTRMFGFTNKNSGDYFYRVRACGPTGQCGVYSDAVMRLVCNGLCD